MEKLPSQPNLGLINGMEVLQLLASTGREMSGAEISSILNIEKTKVNRILKTLAYQGFAKASKSRKYELGPAIHVLSAQILHGSDLVKNAIKHLIELTSYNVVVAMGVLWKDKVAYTYHWTPGIEPVSGLGRIDLFPVTQSSIGITLLSEKTDEEISTIINLDAPIPGFNSKDEFFQRINKARKLKYGYAFYKGNQSIAVQIDRPAKAALAFANINEDESIDSYLGVLRDRVLQIESAMKART